MAKRGESKWTVAEVRQMVDAYLSECEQEQMPPTRQGFCQRWGVGLRTLENWDNDDLYSEHAAEIARVGLACGQYWERAPLSDPRLANFSMFMLKQPCYGGYRDKPEASVSVTIAAKGARINWGR